MRLLLTDTAARLASRHIVLHGDGGGGGPGSPSTATSRSTGAGPLRRLIQREVEDRIADLMVTRDLEDGDTVAIDAVDGEIVATLEHQAAALAA